MGMFGGQRQWNTPGIAGPTDPSQMTIPGMPPQMPQLDMPAPQMPAYQPMGAPPVVPQPRPGFGDPGGMGGKLGQLSDLLLGNNFFTGRQDEQRRAQQAMELAQMKASEAQVVNLGNGGIARVGRDGQMEILREPTPDAPKTPAIQQQIEYIRSLDPTINDAQAADIAERALSGYAYSPEAREAKVSDQIKVADHRAGNSAALKAQPTYAQRTGGGSGGGGKISATRSIGGKVYRKIAGRWYEE